MITQNFQDIFTYEALYRAHLKGRLCKRDKRPLVRFEMRTLQHLHGLYLKLQAGNFKFGTYSSFIVYEPKKRNSNASVLRARRSAYPVRRRSYAVFLRALHRR